MNRNLLIVDDEIEILEWLQELFTYDFEKELDIYTALSGREALDLLNQIRFDVVLTDIKMPGMDGITLFERIKQNWPKCKTVFLTGYQNFDDLYRVMNHKDIKYILKTEGDDTIMQAVRASFDELEQEQEAIRKRADEEKRMEKARHWLRHDLMNEILSGNLPENMQEQMSQTGIELSAEKEVQPYLLRIDTLPSRNHAGETALHMEALIQSIRDNQPPALKLYLHPLDRQHAVLLVQPDGEGVSWETVSILAEGMLEYAQEAFRTVSYMSFSAIISPQPASLASLFRLTPVLRMYMNQYVGSSQEILYRVPTEDFPANEIPPVSVSAQVDTMMRFLELRREKDFYDTLRPCLTQMTRYSSLHDPKALEIYYAIAVKLLQFINENHFNEAIAFKLALYKLTSAEEHGSWIVAAEYLSDVSRVIFELLQGNAETLSDRMLSGVIHYIDSHLDGDLSLTRLAQVAGFNASYLSRLFKQVTGQGPSEYITRKRMALAKTLLSNTNEKIQDIAMQTGYLSAHSFTRAFRAETGISPTEWRISAPGTPPLSCTGQEVKNCNQMSNVAR